MVFSISRQCAQRHCHYYLSFKVGAAEEDALVLYPRREAAGVCVQQHREGLEKDTDIDTDPTCPPATDARQVQVACQHINKQEEQKKS